MEQHPRDAPNPGRKHSKTHSSGSDYSAAVRKKLSTSRRTGQACDRCKIRKLRCDTAPGGCSPCKQSHQAVCETTDRITGKPAVRGLAETLEGENRFLKAKLRDYEQQLRRLGVQVEDGHPRPNYTSQTSTIDARSECRKPAHKAETSHHEHDAGATSIARTEASIFQRHITNESGCLLQNPGFSMLRGTKLALFGMQIDLAEFAQNGNDLHSPTTFEGFVEHLFGRTISVGPAPLPATLDSAKEYMKWFFQFLNPYVPVLDKRDMQALLVKVYEDPTPGPRPDRSAAEEVMVHMMFAQIKYQFGQRNDLQPMVDEAMAHFRYSLALYPDLVRSRTLQDLQAMVIMAIYVRNFPKPGAAWYCAELALTTAVEIGLNRSAAACSSIDAQKMDGHEMEMRKRVFWTLYSMTCSLSGRLGRPVPLRLSDIDIEFPQPVHDNLPEESHLSEFRKCSFHVGIAIDKLLALSGELYSIFYSVSGSLSQDYDDQVKRLEADLATWRSTIPPGLRDPNHATGDLHIHALYLQLFDLEFQFLLRHPLILPPNEPAKFREQLKYCRGFLPKILPVLKILKETRCLDVPWYTLTTFLAIIFTTLFAEDQREEKITKDELQKLKDEMYMLLDILKDVDVLAGSGTRLQHSVGQIIENVLDKLRHKVKAKTVVCSRQNHSIAETYESTHNYSTGNASAPTQMTNPVRDSLSAYPQSEAHEMPDLPDMDPAVAAAADQQQYPAYANGTSLAGSSYQASVYAHASFSTAGADKLSSQVPGSVAVQTEQALVCAPIYVAPSTVSFHRHNASTNQWLQWSQANLYLLPNSGSRDFMASSTANTLLSLGGQNGSISQDTQTVQGRQDTMNHWPVNMFSLGRHDGNAAG